MNLNETANTRQTRLLYNLLSLRPTDLSIVLDIKRWCISDVSLSCQAYHCLPRQQSHWEERCWLDCWRMGWQRNGNGLDIPVSRLCPWQSPFESFTSLVIRYSLEFLWVSKNSHLPCFEYWFKLCVCRAGQQSTQRISLLCLCFHLGGHTLIPSLCPRPLLPTSCSHTLTLHCCIHW